MKLHVCDQPTKYCEACDCCEDIRCYSCACRRCEFNVHNGIGLTNENVKAEMKDIGFTMHIDSEDEIGEVDVYFMAISENQHLLVIDTDQYEEKDPEKREYTISLSQLNIRYDLDCEVDCAVMSIRDFLDTF